MKKTDLRKLIQEEIKRTLNENDEQIILTKLKSGDYDGMDEFVELWKRNFKFTNTTQQKKKAFEITLGRPLTNEEYQALEDAGLVWLDSSSSYSTSQENHDDLVRDLRSVLGKGNALKTVAKYLGRILSKSEIRALISAGILNPRVIK
jgi:hypothetical protein